jgi:hypothetical protein
LALLRTQDATLAAKRARAIRSALCIIRQGIRCLHRLAIVLRAFCMR